MAAAKKTPRDGEVQVEVTYKPTLGRKPYVVTVWQWRTPIYKDEPDWYAYPAWNDGDKIRHVKCFRHLYDAVVEASRAKALNDYAVAKERLAESTEQALL